MRGKEVLNNRMKGKSEQYIRNQELRQNIMGDYDYYKLCFYTGDFKKSEGSIKKIRKASLDGVIRLIHDGIRMFLLYLYEKTVPSKAAAAVAAYIGFQV